MRGEGQHADAVDPQQPGEPGAPGWRIAIHAGCHTGRSRPWRRRRPSASTRGASRQAKNTFDQAERRRDEARRLRPEVRGEGADRRAERDAGRGRRGEPAERAGPIGRGRSCRPRRPGRRRSCRRRRPAPAATRKSSQSVSANAEHDVGDGRRGEPDEQRRPAAVPVGDPAPERRGEQLGDRERGDQRADDLGRGLQLEGVERQQREHDHEADHVHEVHRDQHREAAELARRRRRRSPGLASPARPLRAQREDRGAHAA